MGDVIAFRPKPAPVIVDELAEITAWIKPANDWWTGRMQIELACHFYKTADCRRVLVARSHGRESPEAIEASQLAEKAFRAFQVEGLKQLFIPAECVRHLRWKQDWLKRQGGGTRETELAIARDEQALASQIEAAAKAVATRRENRKAGRS